MSRISRHFYVSALSLVLSAALSIVALPNAASGQGEMMNQIPKFDGAIVWTDDFPQLLEQLESLPTSGIEDWEDAWNPKIDDQGDKERREAIEDDRENASLKLQNLISIWTSLRYDDIFDGQFALVSMFDPSENQFHQPQVVLIARSSSDRDEIAEFVSTVEALFSNKGETSIDDDDTEDSIGEWAYEDGWFCWGDDELIVAEFIDILTGALVAEDTLAEDRAFKNVFANLKSERLNVPSFSFYVTEGGLPYVTELLSSEYMVTSGARKNSWREGYLNELRGFGARFYVDDEDFVDELRAPVAMDAFLLMTQPRRGVLRALGQEGSAGIRLDSPILDLRLSRLAHFELDGDELLEGVIDVMVREAQSRDEFEEVTREEALQENQVTIMRHLFQFGEAVYLNEDGTPLMDGFPGMISARVTEGQEFMKLLTSMSPEFEQVPIEELGGPFTSLRDVEGYAWVIGEGAFAEQEEMMAEQLANLRQQITTLEEQGTDKERIEAQRRQLEQTIESYKLQMEMMKERSNQPMYFLFDDWLIAGEIEESLFEPLVRGLDRRHEQVRDLEDTMEAMQESFRNRNSVCGVLAYWSEGLIHRSTMYSAEAYYLEDSVSDSTATSPDGVRYVPQNAEQSPSYESPASLRDEYIKRLIIRQMENIVLTVSNADDGFRVNGIVSRPKPVEEEEQAQD